MNLVKGVLKVLGVKETDLSQNEKKKLIFENFVLEGGKLVPRKTEFAEVNKILFEFLYGTEKKLVFVREEKIPIGKK